jgi:hypothetical protein
VLLWVSAALALPIESGDCGGSPEACAAAEALAGDRVRLVVVVLLAVTAMGIGALRTAHPWVSAMLLATSAALALAGLWVIAAGTWVPSWVPRGFMFMVPAALLLALGAARRLVDTGAIREP